MHRLVLFVLLFMTFPLQVDAVEPPQEPKKAQIAQSQTRLYVFVLAEWRLTFDPETGHLVFDPETGHEPFDPETGHEQFDPDTGHMLR